MLLKMGLINLHQSITTKFSAIFKVLFVKFHYLKRHSDLSKLPKLYELLLLQTEHFNSCSLSSLSTNLQDHLWQQILPDSHWVAK